MRELDLLQHIYAQSAGLPPRVTIPPGDDMGAVTIGGTSVLVTVDQVADGVHFDLKTTPLAKVARKAVTRNLSDVAAMGAVPVAAVVAACLPRDLGETSAKALSDAMRAVAMSYGCPLIGGDISMWDHPLLISVTVLAEMKGVEPVLRKGAHAGDIICVTGTLGGSLEPLDDPPGYVHHLDFEPRLEVARKLASDPALRPRCMMDLSDGIGKDLPRLCEAALLPKPRPEGRGPIAAPTAQSALSAELWIDHLPISLAAHRAAERDGRPAWQHALGDGEDYELLFTIPAEAAARYPTVISGVPITQIGKMTKPSETVVTLVMPDDRRRAMGELGWEHRT